MPDPSRAVPGSPQDGATARGTRGRLPRLSRRRREPDVGAAESATLRHELLGVVAALADSRRDAARCSALLELARRLAGAPHPPAVADEVVASLPELVGCTSGAVLLWDADLRLLHGAPVPAAGDLHDVPELVGLLTQPELRVLCVDPAGPALSRLLPVPAAEHVLAVPLRSGGRLHGVVLAGWQVRPAPDDPDLVDRLHGLADQASVALRGAEHTAQARHQADHDELTGLPNRRLLLRRLRRALDAPCTGGERVGVLLCDLDGFKGVNDRYGHAAGDELLRQVAARLGAAVREDDTVGRLSGDEFAALLPGLANDEQAQRVAARVLACFAEPFVLEGERVRMTTSVGLALQGPAGSSADALLREADTAMYAAKQRGRNQVVCLPAAGGRLAGVH